MKNLKIRLGLFSLLAMLAVSVFLTSCEQEEIAPIGIIEQEITPLINVDDEGIEIGEGISDIIDRYWGSCNSCPSGCDCGSGWVCIDKDCLSTEYGSGSVKWHNSEYIYNTYPSFDNQQHCETTQHSWGSWEWCTTDKENRFYFDLGILGTHPDLSELRLKYNGSLGCFRYRDPAVSLLKIYTPGGWHHYMRVTTGAGCTTSGIRLVRVPK